MQPQFVVTVGDLIEGGGTDKFTLDEWKELDSYVNKLQMPFFYLPGNHDRKQGAGQRVWDAKLGRSHYHFVYRDTLFLMLCTEDLPGKIGKEQIKWVRKTLADNAKVRWTMVFLHRPRRGSSASPPAGSTEVEKGALAGRKYTVFAGHIHSFKKYVRQGMNHYQLATTGGASLMRGVDFGEFDHFTWVTMKHFGPAIGHVLLGKRAGREPGLRSRRSSRASNGRSVLVVGGGLAGLKRRRSRWPMTRYPCHDPRVEAPDSAAGRLSFVDPATGDTASISSACRHGQAAPNSSAARRSASAASRGPQPALWFMTPDGRTSRRLAIRCRLRSTCFAASSGCTR